MKVFLFNIRAEILELSDGHANVSERFTVISEDFRKLTKITKEDRIYTNTISATSGRHQYLQM